MVQLCGDGTFSGLIHFLEHRQARTEQSIICGRSHKWRSPAQTSSSVRLLVRAQKLIILPSKQRWRSITCCSCNQAPRFFSETPWQEGGRVRRGCWGYVCFFFFSCGPCARIYEHRAIKGLSRRQSADSDLMRREEVRTLSRGRGNLAKQPLHS